MKIIYFILILIFLYLLFTRVKVVHISEVPENKLAPIKVIPNNTAKNMLEETSNNKINKIPQSINNTSNNTINKIPQLVSNAPIEPFKVQESNHNWNDILSLIKSDEMNDDYYFNLPNLPVMHRNKTNSKDHAYTKLIRNNIKSWNNLFNGDKIKIIELKIVNIKETEDEAIIIVLTHLSYGKKHIYLKLSYYIILNRLDDLFESDRYHTQMIDIVQISENNYLGI